MRNDRPAVPFSAALADDLVVRYKLGQKTASSNEWVTNPAQAIAEAMSDPESASLNIEDEELFDTPASGASPPAAPSLDTIPGTAPEGVSEDYIVDRFRALEGFIAKQQAPEGQRPPDEVDPWKQFAAVLAGSFASQIAKRPDLLEVTTRNIENLRKRRQEIMDQNFANKSLFDQNQYNRILSVRVSALNTLMDKAIKDNDMEKAAHYAERLNKMQENARKEISRYEQENQNYRLERTLEASKDEEKMKLDAKVAEEQAKANKPVEMKDYNEQTIRIQQGDPEKMQELVPGWFGTTSKKPASKDDLFLFNDAASAVGGTDEVKAVAISRFTSRLKRVMKLGKDFSKFTDQEAINFLKNMIKYGIPSNLAIPYLQAQGIEIGE